MRSALTKRALDMLEKLRSNDREKYDAFWKQFGQVLKEGPAEDFGNQEKIAGLLQFTTTVSDSDAQDQGLKDYVSRMNDAQEKIYYLVADSLNAARNSPHLEIFRKKGLEVILMHERIDEWLMGYLQEFDGKQFQDITRGELDLGKLEDEQEKDRKKETDKQLEGLLERASKVLGERVQEVRLTHRLTDSAACLAMGEHDLGEQMRKIMEASGQAVPESKPIFELNPDHPLVEKLDQEADELRFEDLISILLDQACLSQGRQLDDPGAYSKRLNKLLLELCN
jgi:molecular chaperone HtpG